MTILLDYQPDPVAFRAALEGETVHAAMTLEMYFASGTVRLTNRLLPFEVDGVQFGAPLGQGALINVSAPELGPDGLTRVMEYGLEIPPDILPNAVRSNMSRLPEMLGDEGEYLSRSAVFGFQLFDAAGTPVGVPVVQHHGRMSRPRFSFSPGQGMSFSIDAESILVRKRTPPAGRLTDLDQRSRYPTDKGLSFVPDSNTAPLNWLGS